MSPRLRTTLLLGLAAATIVSGATAAGAAPRHHTRGVPSGAPPAAQRAAPKLPSPSERRWPFPEAFPKTSGTGRLAGGASLWTDWLFDDHGATAPTGTPTSPAAMRSNLAPTQGVAGYPAGPAKNNGADIFRSAVGMTRNASYWRVDWTTLVDKTVPIAEWTFDTDDNAKTGTSKWPADAGVASPGIDRALVVSAKHVELVNTRTGHAVDVTKRGGRLTVAHRARSFIVRIPRRLLPVGGDWRVRLASGLAKPNGKAFAQPDYSQSLDQGQQDALPNVFNVTFRRVRQEPPVFRNGQTDSQIQQFADTTTGNPINKALGIDGMSRFITGNFWMEDHQADVLENGGNVSAFARVIRWAKLRHHAKTGQPRPRGYSNRWYVSRLHLGQGVVSDSSGASGDLLPNYLTRVQPYAVYVPRHIHLRHRMPLTWILHSLGVNLNQYGALNPHLLKQECQHRHSICATTEGFGPDGWYFDEAEQDFWSVWHALATSYRLDPRRTVISGYSMGGWASYKLGLAHPDLFSQAMPLEGPPNCGIRLLVLDGQQLTVHGGNGRTGRCSTGGETLRLLGNALWLPYTITQGGLDELVPAPSNPQQANQLKELGLRFILYFLPADDHLLYAMQDRFGGIVGNLGTRVPRLKHNPARIRYSWYPNLTSRRLGIGASTAYWVRRMHPTTHAPGAIASMRLHSLGIRDRSIKPFKVGPTAVTTPLPATRSGVRWHRGKRPAGHDRLRLTLSKVRSLTVNARRAGLGCPRIVATTNHRVRLTLTHLRSADRRQTVVLHKGHSVRSPSCVVVG